MSPKDDALFSAALKDADQCESLLKRLMGERRMAKIIMTVLFAILILLMIVQIVAHVVWSQMIVFICVCMGSYVRLHYLDAKVKMLLIQK